MSNKNTGRKAMCEMHGDYSGIYSYIRAAEKAFGGKARILPIEEVEIVNSCGYIFKDSTNMIKYFDDYIKNKQCV